jgi:hypothetical protein
MATTTASAPAADPAALDRIQKSFDALDKIAASRDQVTARRRDAEAQFLASLLAGNFDGVQVLNALTAWKQQDANFEAQLAALAEVEEKIRQSLQRAIEEKSPAFKQVLVAEESRIREQIGKSSDQAAALQKRLNEIRQWLEKFDSGAAWPLAQTPPPKKGGAASAA